MSASNNSTRPRRLIVTAGEPAGIGPDLCVRVASRTQPAEIVVVGDPRVLHERARMTGVTLDLVDWQPGAARRAHEPGTLPVLPLEFPRPDCRHEPQADNAATLIEGLMLSANLVVEGGGDALVTGPIQKSIINDAGIPFSGHTEFLAELTATPLPVMMLVAGDLRVALASIHMPLSSVAEYLSADVLERVIRVLHADLVGSFAIESPRIVICGLNPHAGENGYLGDEEKTRLAPLCERLRTEGFDLAGPLPADTAFTPAVGRADAILAMYHDQGLPVVKYAGFGRAVNVTLGMPIVRTSVDHGTALALAGSGKADDGSLCAAIDLADALALSRGNAG